MKYTVYVIDDEETITYGINLALREHYHVETFHDAETALERIELTPPDIVLMDIGLPRMSGLKALKRTKSHHPDILVIMITGFEDVETVVKSMRYGAYDYITKPLHMETLINSTQNALETIRLKKELRILQEKCLKENSPCYVGESNVIQDVMEIVGKVSKSQETPVFILGETGTGKELIAESIHYRSQKFKGPFVTINCASIPGNLVESELFGYEKGAFSGAIPSGKKGLIEAAQGGTLFLDEIGDLSMEAQAKLLRFLEKGTFYKVGGTKEIKVKTRIVSATNKNPKTLIDQGLFRSDLYYRLAIIKIEVPSLNQRREDIIPMARYFLLEANKKIGKSYIGISPDAEQALRNCYWRGNVRELKNLIERGVILGREPLLTIEDLGLDMMSAGDKSIDAQLPPIPSEGMDLNEMIKSVERHYFQQALCMTDGHESNAAKLLSLKVSTFHYRMKQHRESLSIVHPKNKQPE